MIGDYTPTTEAVRAQFGERARLGWLPNVDPDHYDREAQLAMFDRWLAAHDAEVRAKALKPIRDIVDSELLSCFLHDNADDIVTCGWKSDIMSIRSILKEKDYER